MRPRIQTSPSKPGTPSQQINDFITTLSNQCQTFVQEMLSAYPKDKALNSDSCSSSQESLESKLVPIRQKQLKEVQVIDLESEIDYNQNAFRNYLEEKQRACKEHFPELNEWEVRRVIEREWSLMFPEQREKYGAR